MDREKIARDRAAEERGTTEAVVGRRIARGKEGRIGEEETGRGQKQPRRTTREREREREVGEEEGEREDSPCSGEGFGMSMHDARSEITGFAEPAIMAL